MNRYLQHLKDRVERITMNICQQFYARIAYVSSIDRYTSYQSLMERANIDLFREFRIFHTQMYGEARVLIAKRLEDEDMKLFKSKKAEQYFRTEICSVLTKMEQAYGQQLQEQPPEQLRDIDRFPW